MTGQWGFAQPINQAGKRWKCLERARAKHFKTITIESHTGYPMKYRYETLDVELLEMRFSSTT